jgi:hypothetical protein
MEQTKQVSGSQAGPGAQAAVRMRGEQWLMIFLGVVDASFGDFFPARLDSIPVIGRLLAASKLFHVFKTRRDVLSFFKSLMPRLACLSHGGIRHITPRSFCIFRQDERITQLTYKVWVNADGISLTVRRFKGYSPQSLSYQMRIELFDTTDRRNLSGMLYCTCFDSEESTVARFKYTRESPTLFNEILMNIKEYGIRAYRPDRQPPCTALFV